jgi:hypothetical protein
MSSNFEIELRKALNDRAKLVDVVEVLRAARAEGLTQAEAMRILESLRVESPDEAVEDWILEVMDVVVGFCSPRLRVWYRDDA